MGEKSTRSRARRGAASARCGSGNCMPRTSTADSRNESEFRMNTVSRPNKAATAPPRPDPSARLTDQVIEESAVGDHKILAVERCSESAALRAGSKNAHIIVSSEQQHVDEPDRSARGCTKSIPSTMPARARSASDHHSLAADAVVHHARGGGDEELRKHLEHHRERDRFRAVPSIRAEACRWRSCRASRPSR